MATYEAKVKVVETGGYMKVEVEAGSFPSARDTIQHIYNPIRILDLKKVSDSTEGLVDLQLPNSVWLWGVGLFGVAAAFLYFTPWVLMIVYGGISTWMTEKIVGQSISEYGELDEESTTETHHKKAGIVFASALLFGLIGVIHGTSMHKDLMLQYGSDADIQEIRNKENK